MTLPGVTVSPASSPVPSSPPTDTGVWFVVGFAEKGSAGEAIEIRNMNQAAAKIGSRQSWNTSLYDALELFFREGGSKAYLGRVVGPNPVKASGNLSDGTATTLVAKAKSSGAWGNSLSVITTIPSSGTFQLSVRLSGAEVENSGVLNSNAEALAWAARSTYIDLTDSGGGDPVAATTSLSGGTDDHSNATETEWANALALLTKDLGPGQVSAPGRTTSTTQTALLSHAQSHNRVAILDTADAAAAGTHTAQAAALRALSTARYGGLFGPWVVMPGIAPGTTRTAPPSGLVAGLIARSDSRGGNANAAAAGDNGRATYASGLSQPGWTDADRETLNEGGVNVLLSRFGAVEVYGWRTLVNTLTDDTWRDFGNARLYMQIAAESYAVGERFVFRQIDGRGQTASEFAAALTGEILLPLYEADALYGDSPQDAFSVDVGEQVNTEETIAAGELHALIRARMSPHAEQVEIEITKEAV